MGQARRDRRRNKKPPVYPYVPPKRIGEIQTDNFKWVQTVGKSKGEKWEAENDHFRLIVSDFFGEAFHCSVVKKGTGKHWGDSDYGDVACCVPNPFAKDRNAAIERCERYYLETKETIDQ